MPPPVTDRCSGGTMFWGCVSVNASVRACVPKNLLARYIKNQWMEFHQTLSVGVTETTDKLNRF